MRPVGIGAGASLQSKSSREPLWVSKTPSAPESLTFEAATIMDSDSGSPAGGCGLADDSWIWEKSCARWAHTHHMPTKNPRNSLPMRATPL